ncbi:conjugative transposon protein TraK [Flavitalea sp. BT771]|uniref:conjugative transposon protein TraK n=1 Tax=Flavitalea sp. BT771 TaxID=3063329 RepID=UPI0026E1F622|nr:conjugative transposon protein TraK [Flavitalea sp. BT771]MDO6433050.1 conjugative transposon protein TraK [Flavitalea sp. BT771]MDV6221674.1 conjugative transposon protein TraK [Flavitalea sp. BT771]
MYDKAKNLDTAFQQLRQFCILWMLVCSGLSLFALYKTFAILQASERKVYILSSGKILEALAGDRKENLPVEARDHVRSFHQYFFTLDPDEKVINANIGKALYLADGSAKRLYDNLKENGYYAGVISGNISQQVTVDSVAVDIGSYPYYFRCQATQRIIRPTSITTRNLMTEGWLRNCSRSDNNPHGFLIERWRTLENKDLKVEAR